MIRIVTLVALLAVLDASSAEIGPIKIQRRNAIEHSMGTLNAEGEITYAVDDAGRGVLTVGAHEGNVVVSDPCAIRLAPQRILAPAEWAPALSDGVTADASGTYSVFAAYKVADTVRSIVIETGDPLQTIARVTYDSDYYMAMIDKTISGNSCTISVASTYDSFWDPAGHGTRCYISNVVVYVWSSDSRSSAVDYTVSDLTMTDTIGSVKMSGLRQWVMDRYDADTGHLWSRYPALERVRLAGHSLWFDAFGGVRAGMSGGATNRWQLVANGATVMELTPGVTETSDQLMIVGFEQTSPSQLVFQVSSALEAPVTLQSAATLDSSWADVVGGLTSSYPAKTTVDFNGQTVSAYTLTLAVDPETTEGFYRAKTTLPSYGVTSLEIKNCALIYQGHPLGIVTQVVDGVSYEVLGRVLP